MLLAIQMIGTCEALALGANGLDPPFNQRLKASRGIIGRCRSQPVARRTHCASEQ